MQTGAFHNVGNETKTEPCEGIGGNDEARTAVEQSSQAGSSRPLRRDNVCSLLASRNRIELPRAPTFEFFISLSFVQF